MADGTPGCDDPTCCNMICAADPFCCSTSWDSICANAALAQCAVCALPPVCGNGVPEAGEQCDDGNMVSGDGCSATCEIEARLYTESTPATPVPIPDQGAAGDPLVVTVDVPDCGTILDVNLGLNLTHTWMGDLNISVLSPAGTLVVLTDGTPDDSSNLGGLYTFDDEAATTFDSAALAAPNSASLITPGSYRGDQMLAAFDGQDKQGIWTITIDDTFTADTGTLNSLSLAIQNAAAACGDGCVDPGEECDDGNLINGDGCSDLCEIEVDPCGPGAGDCCSANGTPGCDDADCCNTVCAVDPFCCNVSWDSICAEEAEDLCGGLCAVCPGAGDCCSANGGLGCNDAACCNTVCAADPFCCEVSWDSVCADEAAALCGSLCVVCGNGMTEAGETCDDGNTIDCDGCSATCQTEACGNGVTECAERCDDGNLANGDGCDSTCHAEGADSASLTLEIDLKGSCTNAANGQISVELWMRDLVNGNASGFQAFLEFDDALLNYLPGSSSYTNSPFPLHITPIAAAQTGVGMLRLDGSANFNDNGSDQDSLLATLVFQINQQCGPPAGVAFDTGGAFPSELSYQGNPIATGLVDSPAFVLDNMAPTLSEPADITVDCTIDTDDPANTGGSATGMDNCGPPAITFADTVTPGACPQERTITRTWTATDGCGNSTSADQIIVVDDSTAPVIDGPSGITVNADAGGCTAVVAYSVSAEDDCDESVTAVCSPASGTAFISGMTTVNCSATDDCGNTSMHSFDVTVNALNSVLADVVLDGVNAGAGLTRCIKFVAKGAPPAPSNCCVANGGLGCDNDACEATVCAVDSFCCNVQWDGICAGEASDLCGICPSDCCIANGGLGCDDAACETAVCAIDGFCCDVAWDSICAGEAQDLCAVCEPPASSCSTNVHVNVMFTGNPASGTANFKLPCGTYATLCGKDEQHTLYDSVPLTVAGNSYSTMMPLVLEPGDNDNDSDVDINDVTLLIAQFGGPEPAGGCPWNPLARGADFSNNGNVGSEDYSLLSPNWLTFTSCDCVAAASGGGAPPAQRGRTRIATSELLPSTASRADLNGDGWVDVKDVEEFERRNGLAPELSAVIKDLEQLQDTGR